MADTSTSSNGHSRTASAIPRRTGSSRLVNMQAQFQQKLVLEKEQKLAAQSFQEQKTNGVDTSGVKLAAKATYTKFSSPIPVARAISRPSTKSASQNTSYNQRKAPTPNADVINRNGNGFGYSPRAPPSRQIRQNGNTEAELGTKKKDVKFSNVAQKSSTPHAHTRRFSPQTVTPKAGTSQSQTNKNGDNNSTRKFTRGLTYTKDKPDVLILPDDSNIGPETQNFSEDYDSLTRAAETSTGSDTPDENDPSPRQRHIAPTKNLRPRSASAPGKKPTLALPLRKKPDNPVSNNSNSKKSSEIEYSTLELKFQPIPIPRVPIGTSNTPISTPTPKSTSTPKNTPVLVRKISSAIKVERTDPPPPGTVPCSVCGRCFLEERIAKHETICKKTSTKKRKVFDPTKMRVAGTEAEAFLKLAMKKSSKNPGPSRLAAAQKKADWRKKHEEFIRTIHAAKEYQKHVAAGGNPKDLPPPPPSDYSDYVQCPHCKRKFNAGAAERHVPKCLSNPNRKR